MSVARPRFPIGDGRTKQWIKPYDDPDFRRLSDAGLTAMALRSVAEQLEQRCLSKALPPLLRRAARQLDESVVSANGQEVR